MARLWYQVDTMPVITLPTWLTCMISVSLSCDIRWHSWWRHINTRTTITVDQEWVWLNINWGVAGGGALPLNN